MAVLKPEKMDQKTDKTNHLVSKNGRDNKKWGKLTKDRKKPPRVL